MEPITRKEARITDVSNKTDMCFCGKHKYRNRERTYMHLNVFINNECTADEIKINSSQNYLANNADLCNNAWELYVIQGSVYKIVM